MRHSSLLAVALVLTLGLCAGCRSLSVPATEAPLAELCAMFTPTPVQIDGTLDDPAWKDATAYPLRRALNLPDAATGPTEPGTVRFAWDRDYFYMAVSFSDSDVVAEGESDGLHHYQMGDLAELFLWPDEDTWYLEMYVTPRNRYTTFLFPGAGRRLPSTFAHNAFPIHVAAQTDGTLNDYSDRDRGWTAEMAVPVSELTARGARWGEGAAWRVLVGRYNYSRWLPRVELSECPQLPLTDFHLRESYGRLRLIAHAPATR